MPINTLGISYTNKCNISCRHCSVEADPENKKKLTTSLIIQHIGGFNEHGVREIRFTGGEPAIYIDEIAEIISHTNKYNWKSVLFSNGLWAGTAKNADNFSAKLRKIGVNKVVLSASRYHQEFVGLRSIINAVKALERNGVKAHVNCMFDSHVNFCDSYSWMLLSRNNISRSMYSVCPQGRGASLTEAKANCRINAKQILSNHPCGLLDQIFVSHDRIIRRCCTCCSFPAAVRNNYIFSYGDIRKTSIDELFAKLKAFEPIFKIMKQEGPGGIYLKRKKEFDKAGFRLKEVYYSRCDLCESLLGNAALKDIVLSLAEKSC